MDKISALMDGELDAHQTTQQYSRIGRDADARASWDTFHLIGDALRGERIVSGNIAARLSERLAGEPTVLAPRARPSKRMTAYALSAAASFSAVALVSWVAFNTTSAPQSEPMAPSLATPVVPTSTVQLASVPSEGKMNEYLMAHQEFSPSTAIQGLAPYIRTVSATQTVKGRE
jgi:sigma-E factor negative regulatory protein RseA